MSEKPILYYSILSPPSRAVLLTGAALGIEFELKEIDLGAFENMTPEFVNMNPQHTVPFLIDNGAMFADSHAICGYLVDKYGEDDTLYPKDLVKRTQVNARLHFESGHFFGRLRFLYEPVLYNGSPDAPEERIKYIQTACDILEHFLAESPFVCGDDLTIADLCLIATASSMTETVPFDPVIHANTIKWMERISEIPYYKEINATGAKMLQNAFLEARKKNAEQSGQ